MNFNHEFVNRICIKCGILDTDPYKQIPCKDEK